jgi:hypothetical protein
MSSCNPGWCTLITKQHFMIKKTRVQATLHLTLSEFDYCTKARDHPTAAWPDETAAAMKRFKQVSTVPLVVPDNMVIQDRTSADFLSMDPSTQPEKHLRTLPLIGSEHTTKLRSYFVCPWNRDNPERHSRIRHVYSCFLINVIKYKL